MRFQPSRSLSVIDRFPSLKEQAKKKGIELGVTRSNWRINTSPTVANKWIPHHFDYIVDEGNSVMSNVQASQGTFNFSVTDAVINWGATRNMDMHQWGHLMWYQSSPAWFNALSASQMRAAMEAHIQTCINYYSTNSRVKSYNVVNEVASGSGNGWRPTTLYSTMGSQYPLWAFQAAAAVAPPGVKLIYNDNHDCDPPRSHFNAALQRCLEVKNAGGRIDVFGAQCHVPGNSWYCSGAEYVDRLNTAATTLDCDIYITEFDVTDDGYSGSERYDRCATAVTTLLGAAIAQVPRLKKITFWAGCDKESWLNNYLGDRPDGLPRAGNTFKGLGDWSPQYDALYKALS